MNMALELHGMRFTARAALLVGTGRRAPTDAEQTELGELAAKLPLILG